MTENKNGQGAQVIGYARVSTDDQSLDLQLSALCDFGCTDVYEEKRSGKDMRRDQLALVRKRLRAGDTFVVWKLGRLGRDVRDLIDFMEFLDQRRVEFVSLTDHINTKTAMGKFFFNLMAALAQLERDMTAERTKAGLAAKRERGARLGAPPFRERVGEKKFAQIKRDVMDLSLSWNDLKQKHGHSVTTLRKHFLEARHEAVEKARSKKQ